MAAVYMPVLLAFLEEMGELTDEEFGALMRWGLNYQLTGEDKKEILAGNSRFYRNRLKMWIDASLAEYEAKCEAHREAGKKGGRPPKESK